MAVIVVSDGTVREGPGTAGSRIIARRYPVDEGLTAGDSVQSPPPYLEEEGL